MTGDNDYDTPIEARHGNFVIRRHPDTMPARPGPLEAFDDEMSSDDWLARHHLGDPAHIGPNSNIVNLVFHSRCSGYKVRPTAKDLYEGMRAAEPNPEQLYAMDAWLTESNAEEQWHGWLERAYSWRMLARAMHLTSYTDRVKVRKLNAEAVKPELIPIRDRWYERSYDRGSKDLNRGHGKTQSAGTRGNLLWTTRAADGVLRTLTVPAGTATDELHALKAGGAESRRPARSSSPVSSRFRPPPAPSTRRPKRPRRPRVRPMPPAPTRRGGGRKAAVSMSFRRSLCCSRRQNSPVRCAGSAGPARLPPPEETGVNPRRGVQDRGKSHPPARGGMAAHRAHIASFGRHGGRRRVPGPTSGAPLEGGPLAEGCKIPLP